MSWLSKVLKKAVKYTDPIHGPVVWLYDLTKKKVVPVNARRRPGPLPPQAFFAKRSDGGILFKIIDRSPLTEGNGAVRYDIYFADSVDLSTADTVAAGFARATNVLSINAPGREGADATRILFGERYLSGFFYCVGVDVTNWAGEPTPPLTLNDTSNSGGYPADVEHFSVSESGEVHNSVPYSVISFIYQAPDDANFAGVEFFVKDYPVINEIYATHFHRYTGQRRGTGQDAFKWEIGRRKGTGALTIVGTTVTGSSSAFLAEMNAGDLIEARGNVQTIATVGSNVAGTISSAWIGETITSLANWWIIPSVTIYAVSVGKDGSHREDIENAPSATVFLDGLLSAPVTPVLVGDADAAGLSSFGNLNRLEFDQLAGTEIKQYHLFRGAGTAAAFSACTLIVTETHNPNALGSGHHSIDDVNFTKYERETNAIWSYYLVAENWREQKSAESTRVEIACRMDSSGDTDPTVPARSGAKNLLFNAFIGGNGTVISGTAGCVDPADASQDSYNFTPPVAPGVGILTGRTRWTGFTNGTAGATNPQHTTPTIILFPPPGSGKQNYIWQELDAWDTSATCKFRRNEILCFSGHIKKDGSPNGTFFMYIEPFNAATPGNYAPRRYRSSSTDGWIETDPTNATAGSFDISPSDITTSWQRFYAIWRLDPTQGGTANPTTKFRIHFGWSGGTTGNIYVMQVMLSDGEELFAYTSEMGETSAIEPADPISTDWPGPMGDGIGRRFHMLDLPNAP